MNTTVIYAHPWKGSLNKSILDRVLDKLQKDGDAATLIDLYRDGFNPVMSEEDLSLYSQGKSADPLVAQYIDILDKTAKIIFIFPIWWYDMPAILRGFFDKVMLRHSAYTSDHEGMHPVRNIQKTVLFTTSTAPTEALVHSFGDPVNGTIIAGTFKAIGFFNAEWINLGGVDGMTKEGITQYLNSITDLI
jgi:putative NADPH-quinone reductase